MIFLLLFLTSLFLAPTALAVCPVCTVAVGAGLGLSRWLGIDDLVTGVWMGGILVSAGLWAANWLRTRGTQIKYLDSLMVLVNYLFVFPPLHLTGIIGHVYNTLWGIDKLLLGSLLGSILFSVGVWMDLTTKAKNNGKPLFYYQKVVYPVLLLTVASLILYLVIKA